MPRNLALVPLVLLLGAAALDASPIQLKASIPGRNTLEAGCSRTPPGRTQVLEALHRVESVAGEDHIFRIATTQGPATTMAVMEAAARAGVAVLSLLLKNTGFAAIAGDLTFLLIFSVVAMSAATALFKRTL